MWGVKPANFLYGRFFRSSKRVLTEEPKFIRKRKAKKEETVESTGIPGDVSTPENETD